MVEVDEDEGDPADEPNDNEELEEDDADEEEEDVLLRDGTHEEEDEIFYDELEIPAEKLREVGIVSETELGLAKCALRKVRCDSCLIFVAKYWLGQQAQ